VLDILKDCESTSVSFGILPGAFRLTSSDVFVDEIILVISCTLVNSPRLTDMLSPYRRLFSPRTLHSRHSCTLSPWAGFLGTAMILLCPIALDSYLDSDIHRGYAALLAVHTIDVWHSVLFLFAVGNFAAMPMIVCRFGSILEMRFMGFPQ
jgi:hypothetical protein